MTSASPELFLKTPKNVPPSTYSNVPIPWKWAKCCQAKNILQFFDRGISTTCKGRKKKIKHYHQFDPPFWTIMKTTTTFCVNIEIGWCSSSFHPWKLSQTFLFCVIFSAHWAENTSSQSLTLSNFVPLENDRFLGTLFASRKNCRELGSRRDIFIWNTVFWWIFFQQVLCVSLCLKS